jgi:hypothetical protein
MPCNRAAMERSRYCRKKSRTLILMRQYFCTSFRQRRHVSARCSARRLVSPEPRRMVMVWMQSAEKMLVILFLCQKTMSERERGPSLQMHLSVPEGPLRRHVFGDAADAARGLDHDLGPWSGRFEPEEAIPVYQDFEMALCARSHV